LIPITDPYHGTSSASPAGLAALQKPEAKHRPSAGAERGTAEVRPSDATFVAVGSGLFGTVKGVGVESHTGARPDLDVKPRGVESSESSMRLSADSGIPFYLVIVKDSFSHQYNLSIRAGRAGGGRTELVRLVVRAWVPNPTVF